MKKILFTLAMLFTMSMSLLAEEHETNRISEICKEMKVENFDFNINIHRLGIALDLNADQIEATGNVMEMFDNDMHFAFYECSNASRDNVIKNAIAKNIKYIGYILNKEQQKKYLMLLNSTLTNRGFDTSKL